MLMSAHLSQMYASVKQAAQILKEGLVASVRSVTLVMEGVMGMDVQVSIQVFKCSYVALIGRRHAVASFLSLLTMQSLLATY